MLYLKLQITNLKLPLSLCPLWLVCSKHDQKVLLLLVVLAWRRA